MTSSVLPRSLQDEIGAELDALFEANYRQMLAEGGAHILTPRAIAQAKEQVRYYWEKLRHIALTVTDTEVRLQLPNQRTPKGRTFVIEGVVDLVREAEQIRMYDLKTHYCEEVRARPDSYAAQLNVYAYIWRELRGQELHEMGIIAVQLPHSLREALRAGRMEDAKRIAETWNPLVPIDYVRESLEQIFGEIAAVVDRIEDGDFSPPTLETLRHKAGGDAGGTGRPATFATQHCRNCDGRYSCDPYRQYQRMERRGRRRFDLARYIDAAFDDGEIDAWLDDNLPDDDVELDPALQVTPPASVPSLVRPRRQRKQAKQRRLPFNIPTTGPRLRSLLDRLEEEYGMRRKAVAKECGVTLGTLASYGSHEELPTRFVEKLRAWAAKRAWS